MPNHVLNIVRASRRVLYGLLSESRGIDFNRVIPQPPDDDPIFTATRHDYGDGSVSYSLDGYSPLDWAREHWDTKWNAYRDGLDKLEEGEIQFQTAWNHPRPVLKALSRKFPNHDIVVGYADEDIGWNCDVYTLRNGEITAAADLSGGSAEAVALARNIWSMEQPDQASSPITT